MQVTNSSSSSSPQQQHYAVSHSLLHIDCLLALALCRVNSDEPSQAAYRTSGSCQSCVLTMAKVLQHELSKAKVLTSDMGRSLLEESVQHQALVWMIYVCTVYAAIDGQYSDVLG